MPLVAVHLDPDTGDVLGVWTTWKISAYKHGPKTPRARTLAQNVMDGHGPAPTWDQWCKRLAERRWASTAWQAVPRSYGEDATAVLTRLLAQQMVARRDEENTA